MQQYLPIPGPTESVAAIVDSNADRIVDAEILADSKADRVEMINKNGKKRQIDHNKCDRMVFAHSSGDMSSSRRTRLSQ